MPPQIKRLIPLFIIFIGLFLGVRYILVPKSFGEYGHYRGLSLEENASVNIKYAGVESCGECHMDILELKSSDVHDPLSCETCHGPCQEHVLVPDSADVKIPDTRKHCGLCHSLNPARSRNIIFQIDLGKHYPDKNCIDCHNPHKPWELKDQTPQEGNL